MANRSSCPTRLCKASFLLAGLFASVSAFAYVPPATPNLPLFFEFTGPNAVSESTNFYNSQCDSDNFSWYGVDWYCATGDPANPVCQTKMAYHSTDVNNCQATTNPEFPYPNLTPDVLQEGSGDNKNLIEKLELIRIGQFNKLIDDGLYQDTDLSLARQTNSLLSSLGRTLSYANDNRSIVDAINTWGATNWNEMRNQFAADNIYNTQTDADKKATFQQEMGYIGQKLNYMHDTLVGIENKTGGGGSGGDNQVLYSMDSYLSSINNAASNLYGLSGNMAGQASNIIGNLSQVINTTSATEQSLLDAINESIKALGGGEGGDNSEVVAALNQANSTLSDIKDSLTSTVTDSNCEAFTCSTNNAQCYIARKQWEANCKSKADEAATTASLDSAAQSFTDFINSDDSKVQNIEAGSVDVQKFMSHYDSNNGVSFGGSDTCPPPFTVDATITTFTLDLSPFCELAGVIRFFLLAFVSVASGLMIVKYH